MPRRTSKPSVIRRISALLGTTAVVAASLVAVQTFVDVDPAAATYAEGGDGLYRGSIDWIEWGETPNIAVGNNATASSTRTIDGHDLTTTCRITNLQGSLTTYASGGWRGDSLDNFYNIGGTDGNNTLVNALATANGGNPSFNLSCSTTLDGAPVDVAGIVIADAEASGSNSGEYVQATPVGTATWRVIERMRAPNCTVNVIGDLSADNTLRLRPDAPECSSWGPAAIGFMEGATAANVTLKGGGKSAVALGVVLEADFGDAPESYGSAGALFERAWQGGALNVGSTNLFNNFTLATPGLPNTRLGANIDADETYEPSDGADADDFDDAIDPPGTIAVTPGEEYTLDDVVCTGPGSVAGWIDWNGNGSFDEGERSATAECVGGSVDLAWTVPQDAAETDAETPSYLRLRIARNAQEIEAPTGLSTSGEVEDYTIGIELPQLEITKTSNATVDTRPGDTVEYTVTARNAGDTDFTEAYPAVLFDDLSGVLDDATYEDDASADRPGAVSYAEPLLSWEGALAADDTVTLTYSAVVQGGGDGTARNIAWQPDDHTLETPPTPACTDGGADAATGEPCAATEFLLPKLQITKTADPAELPAVGETATFIVELENVGPGDFTADNPATVTDDLSDVLDDATYVSGSTTIDDEPAAAPEVDGETLTWAGALAAGQTATITYDVTYTGAGDNIMLNTACAPGDSVAEGAVNCAQASVPAANLSSWKTVEADGSPVAAGTALTYTLHFENTGTVGATVDHVDYLVGVLDDADVTAPQEAPEGWTAERVDDTLAIEGVVAAGETATIQYTATVRADGERGDDIAANFLLGAGEMPPEDPTTDPVCEPANPERATCTLTPISGFEVHKTGAPETGTAVDAGSTVTYTVTGENTGATTLQPAEVFDDLSGVLDKATLGDASASIDGEPAEDPVVGDDEQLVWSGALEPDEVVTVTYTVTVSGDAAGASLENSAYGSAVPPGGGDPLVTTPETVVHPVNEPGFVMSKSVDPGTGTAVDPGSVLTYTIVGENTGQTGLDPVEVTDDLSEVLAYATLTGEVSATVDGEPVEAPTLTGNTLSWNGALPVGSAVTITYSVEVDGAAGGETLTNQASGTATPPGGGEELTPPPVSVENPVNEPGFEVVKSSDPESGSAVDPGSTVTYTLSGVNTGETALDGVRVVDDLSGVLTGASYDDNAVATIGGETVDAPLFEDGELVWSGELGVGETVEVTYSVTVGADAGGALLTNVLSGEAVPPGGATITPPPAETEHTVNNPGYAFSKTVDPASGTAVDPGSELTYTLTGENIGQTVLDPVTISDDLSDVLAGASLNGDAVVEINGEQVAEVPVDGTTIEWTGSLAVGETVTVTYTVTVNGDAGGETLSNTASSEAVPPGGSAITPPPGETETPVNLPGFSLSKQVDPASGTAVDPGSEVTYTLTGENTGQTRLTDVQVSDDLSGILEHAAMTTDPVALVDGEEAGDLSVEDGLLSWAGSLAVGENVEITFTVTVDADAGGATLENAVTGSAVPPGGETITPPTSNVTNPVNEPGYEFSKSVTPESGTAVDPGSVLTYILTGVNTGQTALDPVEITDDLTGVLAGASWNGDAVAVIGGEEVEGLDAADGVLSWTGDLQVGETVTITYTVTVDGDAGGQTLANTATSEATPPGGATITPPPGETETPVNEPGYEFTKSVDPESGTAVDPGSVLTYTLTGVNTGQTALDEVTVSDDLSGVLAGAAYGDDAVAMIDGVEVPGLTVEDGELSWAGSLGIGESVTITYSVTVDGDAGGTVLSNTASSQAIPPGGSTITPPPGQTETPVNEPGYEFTKTADPASGTAVDPGSQVVYTLTGENTGETALDSVTITDDMSGLLEGAAYDDNAVATIGGEEVDGLTVEDGQLSWAGSLGVGETVTITYSVTVGADSGGQTLSNTASSEAVPPGGSTITPPPGETETPVNLPGFSLSKQVDPESGTAVDPGSVLTYTLTGVNTGETALDPVDIVDDFSGVLEGAAYNDDAAATINGETADAPTVEEGELAWSGDLQVGETVEIVFSVTVDPEAGGQTIANSVTGSAVPPGGSTITPPPSNVTNPVNEPGYEFSKSVSPASGTAVDPGSVVTYTLTGVNTGQTALDPVSISDDLSGVLAGAEWNGDAVATIGGEEVDGLSVEDGQLDWAGSLGVGQTVTITYTVTVDPDAGGETLANTASSEAVPPGGSTITPPPGETETPVNLPGFSLSKQVDPESGTAVDPGSVLTYTLTGVNTGETALDPVDIVDDFSGVLEGAAYNDDAAATINGETADAPTVEEGELAWSGDLQVGETVEIVFSVTVDPEAGGQTIANSVTGSAVPPGGSTITPPPSNVTNPVNEPGYEFSKTVDPETGTAVDPGSVLTYTLTGENTGETVLHPVEISDDLSGVLAGAAWNDDAVATIDGVPVEGLSVDDGELSWAGSLGIGQTVTVTYTVTVDPEAGGQTLANRATSEAVPPGGATITPPPGETETPVNEPGYEFTKTVDPAAGTAVDPGSVLTYTLTGENTGQTVLDPVTISDDLSGVLAGAEWNGDAVATIGGEEVDGLSVGDGQLDWTGSLGIGQTVTITYTVTVDPDAGGSALSNTATSEAVPPGGATITPPPTETETPVNEPGFEISKTADPESGTSVDPGSVLTYTLVGENTGQTALDPVEVADDLSGVLSGASFNDDAVATVNGEEVEGLSVEDGQLSWAGPLAVGESVEITYSVTVDADAGGTVLSNAVTGSAVPPGGATITPPPVSTENPVNLPGFEFSKSVDPASGTSVDPGSVLTYTLTGVNTGQTVLDPVDISDDLSAVLNGASFNDDAVAMIGGEEAGTVELDGADLSWSGSLGVGETVTVTYSVTVDGDTGGQTLANSASATAVPPGGSTITPPPGTTESPVNEPGFSLWKAVDPESGTVVDPGSVLTYTITGVNTGETALDEVLVSDDLSGVVSGASYNDDAVVTIDGESVDGLAVDGDNLSWGGSLGVGQTVEITFSVTVSGDAGGTTLSNTVTGSAVPPGGATITPPPSTVTNPVNEPGYEFTKTADPETGTAVDPGSIVTYTLTGANTGQTVLDPVTISDDLSGVLAGATFNDDAVATIGGDEVEGLSVEDGQLNWAGSLAAGETVTVTYSVTVNADAGGIALQNSASSEAVPPGGSTITPPPASTENPVNEPGFEVSKTADPESGAAVDPGSVVTYTLTGANTGQTVLEPVELVDDLSGVLEGASFNDDAVATIGGGEVEGLQVEGGQLSWAGSLAAGETVTVTYSVTVNADAGGATLSNALTGVAVPPGGAEITPPPVQTENPVNEPGFEFTKTADPETGTAVDPGSVVTYTLTGANTGQTVLDPVEIADDLSGVLNGASYNDDAVATIGGDEVEGLAVEDGQLTWTGSLPAGESVVVTYSVTVDADAGGSALENSATATATPPGGSIISPPPAETVTPVKDPGFEFSKTVDPASGTAVDAGDTVTYTLTGQNTGETILDPVEIADDLSGVLSAATLDDGATVEIDGEQAEGLQIDGDELSWSGVLEPGQTVTVTYSVTVDADAEGATLENAATASATPPGGIAITPPPAETANPVSVPGFSLSKAVDPETGTVVGPGDTVTYRVTGVNTGDTVLDPVNITDDLSGVLSGATLDDGAAVEIDGEQVDGLQLDGDQLSWSGVLEPGQTVTISYTVTVSADAGSAALVNTVSGSATPPGGTAITPPPAETTNPVAAPGFEFSKTVDPETGTAVDAGDTVIYTLTGVNTGTTVLDPVDIVDDLSGVLSAATLTGDPVAEIDGAQVDGVVLDGDQLSWSGALEPGQAVTVTYAVTVNADAGGATLSNVATATGVDPSGNVIEPPAGQTENPVRAGGGLSPSGMDQAPVIAGIAGLMLLLGASAIWFVTMRRRRA